MKMMMRKIETEEDDDDDDDSMEGSIGSFESTRTRRKFKRTKKYQRIGQREGVQIQKRRF